MGYQVPPFPRPLAETHTWYKYERGYAVFPIKCINDRWVWFATYYKKYLVYSYKEINDICYFRYNITEDDAIIEKLTDSQDNLTF